jgi:hypothetical protein
MMMLFKVMCAKISFRRAKLTVVERIYASIPKLYFFADKPDYAKFTRDVTNGRPDVAPGFLRFPDNQNRIAWCRSKGAVHHFCSLLDYLGACISYFFSAASIRKFPKRG